MSFAVFDPCLRHKAAVVIIIAVLLISQLGQEHYCFGSHSTTIIDIKQSSKSSVHYLKLIVLIMHSTR